jgi:hypothetical protein
LLVQSATQRHSGRQLLLDAGADPNDGESLYHSLENPNCTRVLLQYGAHINGTNALGRSLDMTESTALELLLAHGGNANDRIAGAIGDFWGSLLLHAIAVRFRLLPDTVAWGNHAAAMLMVELGWPVGVRGGDWDATALNLAVFRGDAQLTEFLLDRGASWHEKHGYGDDVIGTLSWTSVNRPVADGDWVGCAHTLLRHGLAAGTGDTADPERVLIEGRWARFSEEVAGVLSGGGIPG